MMFYTFLFLSVVIPMCTAGRAEPEIFKFKKETFPSGRKINDHYSDMVSASSLSECARTCYEDENCLSFIYKEGEGSCRIMGRMHVDFGEVVVDDGSVLYIDVCDVPTTQVVPNGRLLYVHPLSEGAVAEYECDDHYFPTTATGVCEASGQWTGLDTGCQPDNDGMTDILIKGKFEPDTCVNIIATPTSTTSALILFFEENGDVNFFNEIIFNKAGESNIVSRNSAFGGSYGTYEKDTPIFPFAPDQEFDIVICASDTHYTVTSGADELYTYAFRSSLGNLDVISLRAGITGRRVRFQY